MSSRAVIRLIGFALAALGTRAASGQYYLPTRHCVGCHPVQGYEWKQSAHARAYTTTTFQDELAKHIEKGGQKDECLECHAPLALQKEWVWDGYNDLYLSEGVTCDVCHKIVEACIQGGNGHFDLQPGKARLAPLLGAVARRTDGLVRHEGQYSLLHTKSDLCAGCHEGKHLGRVLRAFTEWKEAKGPFSCQECHMPGSAGFASIWSKSPSRPRVSEHKFTSMRVALTMGVCRSGGQTNVVLQNLTNHAYPTGSPGKLLRLTVTAVKSGAIRFCTTFGPDGEHPALPAGRFVLRIHRRERLKASIDLLRFPGTPQEEVTLVATGDTDADYWQPCEEETPGIAITGDVVTGTPLGAAER